jgi:hypothetical protein
MSYCSKMKKLILSLTVLTILVMSNAVHAGNNSVISYSPTNITQAMDVAVRSNSMSYLYTLTASQIDSVNKGSSQSDSLRLKNPNTALLIAVIPGFVFHGSGHFYARKSLTGLALLATESVGLMVWRRGGNFLGSSGGGTDAEQVQFIIGMALFFGSWAYDLIGAPLAVNNENERLLGQSK